MTMRPTRLLMVAAVAAVAALFGVEASLVDTLIYVENLNRESYKDFVNSVNHLAVVYFFKHSTSSMSNFFKEFEKSAAIMTIYETKFGIVNCQTYPGIGHCDDKDSDEQVYMYRNGYLALQVSLHSMFSVDSIISNVLQVVLLYEALILQSIEEKDRFISENRGFSDVVFSYQKALGTYDHRILMETIFVYHHSYNFALSNEQKTVADLPHYSSTELSGIWLFRCKSVRLQDQSCPVYKFRGPMERANLSRFFQALALPSLVHDVGKGNDSDLFRESEINVLYIFYDGNVENAAKDLIKEFSSNYFGLMGIVSVNVNTVDMTNYTFPKSHRLPLLAFQSAGTNDLVYIEDQDAPANFVEKMLNVTSSDGEPRGEPHGEPDKTETPQEEYDLDSDEMEAQDDIVAKIASELRNVTFTRTHLPALTDKTFYSEVNERSLLIVLFYLDFDARNQIVARLFAKAAEVLAKDDQFPLAAVECFDWTDVCGKANVSVYPTIRIYRSNMEPVLYNGPLSVNSFVTAAKLHMMDNPVALSTTEEVLSFVEGDFPGKIKAHTNVAVVGAFGNEHMKYEKTFRMAAKELQGHYLCGIVKDNIAESTCKTRGFKAPCIIASKRHDQLEPVTMVKLGSSVNELIGNIESAVLPLLPELTAENFPVYFAMKKPLLILFTANTDGTYYHAISAMASEGTRHEVALLWMNISSPTGMLSPGEQILHHHVKEPNQEEILVISHGTGQVHRFTESKINKETALTWLSKVTSGSIETTIRLSPEDWKPRVPAFDFLKKIDDDAAARAARGGDLVRQREQEEDLIDEESDEALMMDNETRGNLEDEIQMELEQLKYSRLYQKSPKKPIHKPESASQNPNKSEDNVKSSVTLGHTEL